MHKCESWCLGGHRRCQIPAPTEVGVTGDHESPGIGNNLWQLSKYSLTTESFLQPNLQVYNSFKTELFYQKESLAGNQITATIVLQFLLPTLPHPLNLTVSA